MRFIKHFLFVLLLPSAMYGQTVHIDEDRIVYKGTVDVVQVNKEELYERVKNAVYDNVKGGKEAILEDNKDKGIITVKGTMKLATPYHLIRTVGYILELSVDEGKYKYRIDSVNMKQVERGGKTIKISSTELFKGMEATGPEAVEAEKLLNEIDMNFQKLLDLINADMKKSSLEKNSTRD